MENVLTANVLRRSKVPRLALIGAIGVAVASAVGAGAANAAPGEPSAVTLTASARGTAVTTTLHNESGSDLQCVLYATTPGSDPFEEGFVFSQGAGDILAGGRVEFFPLQQGATAITFRNIPAGQYDVDWGCRDAAGTTWGTTSAWSSGATTQPTPVTVVAPPSRFGSS